MNCLVGTSGYAYKEWKGPFYPEKLPADQMLRFYGERFPTVEINNTFYRMPSAELLCRWGEEVPDDFSFVLKASRRITHIKRLKEVGDDVKYLLDTAGCLEQKLGPLLFQLPPNLKIDLERLRAFLDLLPAHRRAAMEFRHESWNDPAVHQALRARNVALCLADIGDDEDDGSATVEPGQHAPPATATWGYLRLRRGQYSEHDLRQWAKWVRAQPWEAAYIFFKHEDEGIAPQLALQMIELVGSRG